MSSQPDPKPTTQEGRSLWRRLLAHMAIPHLGDLDVSAASPGDVPTLQADGTYELEPPPGAAGGAPVGSARPKALSGAGSAGASSNSSREDHVHPITTLSAADHGFLGWTGDPSGFTTTVALSTGTILYARAKVVATGPITNVIVPVTTGATATNAYLGVYLTDGTELGRTADIASTSPGLSSSGDKTLPLTAPTASVDAGTIVVIAIVAIGGSMPSIRAATAAPSINFGLVAASPRRLSSLAGQTGLPAPAVFSSTAGATSMPLLALS